MSSNPPTLPSIRTLLAEPIPANPGEEHRSHIHHQRHASSPFSGYPGSHANPSVHHGRTRGHMRSGSDGFAPSFTFPPRKPQPPPVQQQPQQQIYPSLNQNCPAQGSSPTTHIGQLANALAETNLHDSPDAFGKNPPMEPDLTKMRTLEMPLNLSPIPSPSFPPAGSLSASSSPRSKPFSLPAMQMQHLCPPGSNHQHSYSVPSLSPSSTFSDNSKRARSRTLYTHHRSVSDFTHPYSNPMHRESSQPSPLPATAVGGNIPTREESTPHTVRQHRRAVSHTSIDSILNNEPSPLTMDSFMPRKLAPPSSILSNEPSGPSRLDRSRNSPSSPLSSGSNSASSGSFASLPGLNHGPTSSPVPANSKFPHTSPSPSSSTGSQNRYQCPYCSKRFSRPSSLKIHTYSHTGEKPFVCTEEGCGRSFSVQSNLRRHMRVHIKKPHKE
ncbi:uncharacterized protein VTP21DRAFT_10386 [Calcarisporiella thermophila]|uniref:uncharacterized protein n=1 Tax=Calcarisporiella thermophila TaxID=911321 RepID=UPI003744A699